MMMLSSFALLVTFLGIFCQVQALKYPLEDDTVDGQYLLVPSLPQPMYSYDDSPLKLFASREKAAVSFYGFIPTEANGDTLSSETTLYDNVYFLVLSSSIDGEFLNLFDLGYRLIPLEYLNVRVCEADSVPTPESISSSVNSVAREKLTVRQKDGKVSLSASVPVATTGYYYAFVVNCNEVKKPITIHRGSIIFRNPHGFLPGGWYLKLPFSAIILIGYFVFLFIYVIRCIIFREDVMYIQFGVIVVLLMGLVEQLAYYFTFMLMNYTGKLPCCPVRTDMSFCMIISAAKRAALVIFLLAVSLGYGIQRASLLRKEWIALLTMAILYLLFSVAYEMSLIAEIDALADPGESDAESLSTMIVSISLSVLNLIAVTWIYFSIIFVIDQLDKEQQQAKKKMYEKLAKALILWFVIGFIAETLFYISISGKFSTPWKYDMVPKFIWDCLFFAVVIQIGYLWYPSSVSSQYAYSEQLPMHDLDEFDALDVDEDLDKELEMTERKTKGNRDSYEEADDGDGELDRLGEEEDEDDFSVGNSKKKPDHKLEIS